MLASTGWKPTWNSIRGSLNSGSRAIEQSGKADEQMRDEQVK